MTALLWLPFHLEPLCQYCMRLLPVLWLLVVSVWDSHLSLAVWLMALTVEHKQQPRATAHLNWLASYWPNCANTCYTVPLTSTVHPPKATMSRGQPVTGWMTAPVGLLVIKWHDEVSANWINSSHCTHQSYALDVIRYECTTIGCLI